VIESLKSGGTVFGCGLVTADFDREARQTPFGRLRSLGMTIRSYFRIWLLG
jgi:hypothetical protein